VDLAQPARGLIDEGLSSAFFVSQNTHSDFPENIPSTLSLKIPKIPHRWS
jgi:hypothetical protein